MDVRTENVTVSARPAVKRNPKQSKTFKRAPAVRKTETVCTEICVRLSQGESLREILKDPRMPASSRVYEWLGKDDAFREQYARARQNQADSLADEILALKDDIGSAEQAQIRKVQLDVVKWFASKVYPKKYGDRPGDIHVTTAVGVQLPEQERLRLIERQRQAETLPAEIEDTKA